MSDRPDALIHVTVTGPDVSLPGGAGVQRHVLRLIEVFEDDPGVTIVPFGVAAQSPTESLFARVRRVLQRWRALRGAAAASNVVHINASIDRRSLLRDTGFVVAAKRAGKRVVLQWHGGGVDRLGILARPPLRWLFSRLLRRADVVLFLSEEQATPFIHTFGVERVRYVFNGVAVADRLPQVGGDHPLRVLYLGRVDAVKGVLEAMDGFVRAGIPGAEMRIAGSGDVQDEVRRRAEASDEIDYLGYVDGRDKDALLDWSDAIVLPSSHAEGLPYGLLEAAARGTAMIASDSGAVRRLVREGETGFLVPGRDAATVAESLRRLASDAGLLAEMKRRAYEVVREEYSSAAMAALFRHVYEDVLAGRSERP